MKLYLVSQSVNDGCDTYSGMVVAANSEDEAKRINPSEYRTWQEGTGWIYDGIPDEDSSWANKLEDITCQLLGEAAEGVEPGVILARYHAG